MTVTARRAVRSTQPVVVRADRTAVDLPPLLDYGVSPRTAASLICAGGLALTGLLSGTATTAPIVVSPVRYIGEWTSTARVVGTGPLAVSSPRGVPSAALVAPQAVASASKISAASSAVPTQAEEIQWLHDASGLTWEQLGRVFGVSRRAVHLWANGGRMNGTNAELLGQLVGLVRALPAGNADERRAALLAPSLEGPSLVDQFRARHQVGSHDITGSPFRPEELLGALHDGPEGSGRST